MPVYRKDKDSWKVVVKRHGRRKDWIVQGSKKEAEAFEARKRLEIEAADWSWTRASFRPSQTSASPSTALTLRSTSRGTPGTSARRCSRS
jgi:hypothetical protein